MQITIPKQNKQETINFSGSALELLNHLNINKETVLVSVNNQLVGEDHIISNEDDVIIHSVISGG